MVIPLKFNRDKFEKVLNESREFDPEDDNFIIGGKLRRGRYGTMLRRHDPQAFNVAYHDWLRENKAY